MTLGLAWPGACGPQRAAAASAPQPPPQPQGSAEEEPLPDFVAHEGVGVGAVSPAGCFPALTAQPASRAAIALETSEAIKPGMQAGGGSRAVEPLK